MTDALDIAGIDAFYGDSHVLHGVSFTLKPGRLLGLLGRNGAGKTTCMAAIMGFLKPRNGTISLYGEPVAGFAPDVIARKGICLVPQGRRMFRTLTVRENLMVAAQPIKQGGGPGWSLDRVFQTFPAAQGAPRPGRGLALRRRAADAGDRPRADGQSARAADGRAVRGAGAATGGRSRPHHRATQGRGAVDRAGRAEHQADARTSPTMSSSSTPARWCSAARPPGSSSTTPSSRSISACFDVCCKRAPSLRSFPRKREVAALLLQNR